MKCIIVFDFRLKLLQSFAFVVKNNQIDLIYPVTSIRHIARMKGLAGSDDMEQAKIDDILETLAELEKHGLPHMEFIARLNKILNDMEKQLVANGGHFLVGHNMSIADIGVYVVLDQMSDRARAMYPHLKVLYESIDISLYF